MAIKCSCPFPLINLSRAFSTTPSSNDPRPPEGGEPNDDRVDPPSPAPPKTMFDKLSPYYRLARLDKPIGTMLLLWPCYWSIGLAAPLATLPDFKMMALFSAGALIMRGAGCTINDYWDRDIDGKVERTKNRPIASGEVSPENAIKFFAVQSLAGLGILVQLPTSAIILGACSMPLVIGYPLAKRFFPMPQLVLGAAFNWGALLGGAAVASSGMPNWEWALPLYGGAICWTLIYDTLYAHQDKVHDAKLGLHSSALTLGNENTKPFLLGCSVLTVGGIALAGYGADMTWPFYAATSLGIFTMFTMHRASINTHYSSFLFFPASLFSCLLKRSS
jgi:4-hydroxybenzoate polyprenyltransferase